MSAYNFAILIFLYFISTSAICRAASKMDNGLKEFPTSVGNYKLSNGDIILCVPVEDQPSLINGDKTKFTAKPSEFYKSDQTINSKVYKHQLFASEVGSCEENTIPVLYTNSEQHTESAKKVTKLHQTRRDGVPKPAGSHEHSYGSMRGNFTGMMITLNIWQPHVELPSEFSLAQLWVNSDKAGALNTIEAGWQIFPDLYSGDTPRLFVFWTADDYKTGCYNLKCNGPGFVQVSNKFVLGGTYSETSKPNSTQYESRFLVFQDNTSGNWWLRIDGEDVGYWPASLFNSLSKGFEILETGGEVYYDLSISGRHTKTQMGSGKFADAGFGQAAYIRRIQYLDSDGQFQPALDLRRIDETPQCYSSSDVQYTDDWGVYFFFGGPGFSPDCP